MKKPIKWHKDCLISQRKHLARNREEIKRMQADCDRLEKDIMLRDSQIIRAEAMGKDGFDPDKFGLKK